MKSCVFAKLLISILILSTQGVHAAVISSDIPIDPDPNQIYLFYLHNKLMENQGIPAKDETHGEYAFIKILNHLSVKGVSVIAEWRPPGAKKHPYAFRIARKVRALIEEQGVSASNITVAGFEKGGKLALLVSSYLGEPEVNYAILGACPRKEDEAKSFVEEYELIPNGRILSLYDQGHETSGSCSPLLDTAEAGTRFHEIEFTSGVGQGLFFRPDVTWIRPLLRWSRGLDP
jgi:hypothetical protein